jgi:hypothetical protein
MSVAGEGMNREVTASEVRTRSVRELCWNGRLRLTSAVLRRRTPAQVRQESDAFSAGLAEQATEVWKRYRTSLDTQADALIATVKQLFAQTHHVDLTLVSVLR